MKNKRIKLNDIKKVCKSCHVGSCCYEGAELNSKELKRIIRFNPKVAKPWFRMVGAHEEPEKGYSFSTVIRNNTCVFQDKNNRCLVYKARPAHCRDFPEENNKAAPYLQRLCVIFSDFWPNNRVRRIYRHREKNNF